MGINTYTKTNWTNNDIPAINETNLDKIEDGIYNSVRTYAPSSQESTTAVIDAIRFKDGKPEFHIAGQEWFAAGLQGEAGYTYVPSIVNGVLKWTTTDPDSSHIPDDFPLYQPPQRNFTGAWDGTINYKVTALIIPAVSHNGINYIALQDSLNKEPGTAEGTDYWEVWANGGPIDLVLDTTSDNAIANSAVATSIETIRSAMGNQVTYTLSGNTLNITTKE